MTNVCRFTVMIVMLLIVSMRAYTPSVTAKAGFVHVISPINYVALGDSRAADPQDNSFSSSCNRSIYSYPNTVVNLVPTNSFKNVSCIGATIRSFFHSQTIGSTKIPPQLDALSLMTDVVTLSIGGNDILWYRLIQSCFTQELGKDAHCRYDIGLNIVVDSQLNKLKNSLDLALKSIHQKSPLASIFLVGHGGYYGTTSCSRSIQISPEDLEWVHGFFTKFNTMMAQIAHDNHDYFVDVESNSHGHDACSSPAQRWFTGNVSIDGTPMRHPTPLGSQAIGSITAKYITSVLEANSSSSNDVLGSGISSEHSHNPSSPTDSDPRSATHTNPNAR